VWPLCFAALAAFSVRIALSRGDLWGDEAASVMLGLRPAREVLATLATAEPHPPLFPLLMKVWIRLVGSEELVVRFPSIAAGVLIAPVLGALGRSAGPRVGAVAAVLGALSPFLLWYTTEARMYGLTALTTAVSCYWLARLLRRPDRGSIVGYGVATALALLTHYFALFVGVAQAVVALAALVRYPRLLRPLALAAGLALAPFALWAAYAARIVGGYYGAAPGTVDLVGVLASAWARLPIGWSVEPRTAALTGAALTLPIVAGAWLAWRRPGARWWVAWLVVPAVAGMVVSVVRPMYQERYLVVLAPPYLLLLALVVARGGRAWRAVALAGAVALAAVPLWNLAAGRYVRSQYGSHAAEANALALPGEAAVLTGPSQAPLYDYYGSRGGVGMPVFGLPHGSPAPEPQTSQELAQIAERFRGLWLFLYAVHDYDPADVVERWLTANTFRAPARWTINGRLIHFTTEGGAGLGPVGPPQPIGSDWSIGAALPAAPIPAGSLVPLRLELTPRAAPTAVPKLRLRLIDDRGFLWGEADEVLGSGFLTAAELAPGKPRLERRAVAALAGAPESTVKVEAQLYLEADGGTRALGTAELGSVRLAPSDHFWDGQVPGLHRVDAAAGGWRLLGWAGADAAKTGERAYLTTVWRAESTAAPLVQGVRFVGRDGRPISTRTAPLTPAAPGTVRRIQLAPPVGTHWNPGDYRLELGLYAPGATAMPWESGAIFRPLGTLRVAAGAPPPPATEPAVPIDADFGGAIGLRGFSTTAAPFALTLHWEAHGEVDRGYSVFVHLLDPSGKIVAQTDGPPAGGAAPTDGWSRGDRVDDVRRVAAPAGRYTLRVGLYDPGTGARLSVARAGAPPDDHLDLGEVTVGG
jgi:4-amino-4-deoxy-L-arabinose transferase-like glycosyltransferase